MERGTERNRENRREQRRESRRNNREQNRTNTFGYLLSALVVCLLLFSGYQVQEKERYKQLVDNGYRAELLNAAAGMDSITEVLGKIQLANQPAQNSAMFADIKEEADSVHKSLSSVAYNHNSVKGILFYLSNLSDTAYAMLQKGAEGKELTAQDWQKIREFKSYSEQLADGLNAAAIETAKARTVYWDNLFNEQDETKTTGVKKLAGSIHNVAGLFNDYAAYDYNGETYTEPLTFSPALLEGKSNVTEEEARVVLEKLLLEKQLGDYDVNYIVSVNDKNITKGIDIPVYSFEMRLKNNFESTLWADVTRKGGYLLWFVNGKAAKSSESGRISLSLALKRAEDFTANAGYVNMKCIKYNVYEDMLYATLACNEEGLMVYTDTVVVKVNMYTGEILAFDASGYVRRHEAAENIQPKLPKDQALALLSDQFKIIESGLAIIEDSFHQKALCYEVWGEFDGKSYVIYINGDSGRMERIEEVQL